MFLLSLLFPAAWPHKLANFLLSNLGANEHSSDVHKLSKTESLYLAVLANHCAPPCVDIAFPSKWPHRHIKCMEKVQELFYLFIPNCIWEAHHFPVLKVKQLTLCGVSLAEINFDWFLVCHWINYFCKYAIQMVLWFPFVLLSMLNYLPSSSVMDTCHCLLLEKET